MTVIFVKKNLMHDVIFLFARRLDNSLSKNGNKMTAHVDFSFNMQCAKFNIEDYWAKIAELSKSNKVPMTAFF